MENGALERTEAFANTGSSHDLRRTAFRPNRTGTELTFKGFGFATGTTRRRYTPLIFAGNAGVNIDRIHTEAIGQ